MDEILNDLASHNPKGIFIQPDINNFIDNVSLDDKLIKKYVNSIEKHIFQNKKIIPSNIKKIIKKIENFIYTDLGCGAGYTMVTIMPNNALYPCSWTTHIKSTCFGDLKTGINKDQKNNFVQIKHKDCHQCIAMKVCGGGCYLENIILQNKSIHNHNNCKIFKQLLNLSLKYIIKNSNNYGKQITDRI